MKPFSTAAVAAILATLTVTGCGKPKSAGGPQGGMMPMPAVLARASEEAIDVSVDLVASLESRDSVNLLSELESTVVGIRVVEGQAVKKGDVLFTLDDVKVKSQFIEATSGFELARLSHDRNKGLLDNSTISQQEFDESIATLSIREAGLTLASDQLSNTVIRAPFDGSVGERAVSVGQFVRPGDTLIEVVGTQPLDIAADVPERYLNLLEIGQVVNFQTDAYAGSAFAGKIRYISPSVSRNSRTVRIKAEVDNADGRLRPGLFGRVRLVTEHREKALIIPESAISFSKAGQTVISVNGEGIAEFKAIEVGQRYKGRVEITRGLNAGDIVVIEGGQKMGPGSLVMAAPDSANYGVTPGPIGDSAAPAAKDTETPHVPD